MNSRSSAANTSPVASTLPAAINSPAESVSPALSTIPSPQLQDSVIDLESPFAPPTSVQLPVTLTAVPTVVLEGRPVHIGADDPRIRYTGRFDFTDPQRPYFDWSGVSIKAAFTGPSLSILLEDGVNYYSVTIDGQSKILPTTVDETTYLVADDLPEGAHNVELTKRTEAYVGAGVFTGFVLEAGHDLLTKPPSAERHIEFVGDSITTGYGNEGDSPHCWFTAETQNVERSFAAQTADHFNADYTVIALSGLGVVRNLRSQEVNSAETAVDFIDRTVAMNPALTWGSQNESPDAVVVNLGTNDFSSLPFPAVDTFEQAYVDLLLQIRIRYPKTAIFAIAGPLMLDPAQQAIRTTVERRQNMERDNNVYLAAIEDTFDQSEADFGCDWHPNVQGHKKITEQLVPVMAGVLGW